tara:strand:- start:171 stop:668 length:498 start_codon:yes stop_codon:yes gene_type:complete
MKSVSINFILILFFYLGSSSCFSQKKELTEDLYKTISQINVDDFSGLTEEAIYSNKVRIQQIGNGNTAIASSYASGIEMNLLQQGNDNYTVSIVRVENYKLNAVQKGNANYFSNMPVFSEPSTQLEVIQEGNNQHIENNGANAISKNMSIRITGDNRMLTIQNIK